MPSGYPGNSAYPAALNPITPKVTADNGGDFSGILQDEHKMALVATPTDLATSIAAITAIKTGLIALGLMKAT